MYSFCNDKLYHSIEKKKKKKDVWAAWTLLALWCWPAIAQPSSLLGDVVTNPGLLHWGWESVAY